MAIAVALTGSDQTVFTGEGHYFGFTIRETAGSTATVRIHDNTANSGTILDTIQLAPNESAREWYGPQGILLRTGIRVDIVSGTVEGSVRYG